MRLDSRLLLQFFITLSCLIYYLILPSSSENDWLWGISLSRFILIAFFLFLNGFILIVLIKLIFNKAYEDKLLSQIKNHCAKEYNHRIITTFSFLGCLIVIHIIGSAFIIQEIYLKTIFTRILPFLIWITIFFIQLFLFYEECYQGTSFGRWWLSIIQKNRIIFLLLIFLSGGSALLSYQLFLLPAKKYPAALVNYIPDIKLLLTLVFYINILAFVGITVIKILPIFQRFLLTKVYSTLSILLLYLGCLLLIINLVGLLFKLTRINYEQEIMKRENESNVEYAYRLTEKVHQRIKQISPNEIGQIVLTVPIQENYLLFVQSHLKQGNNRNFELCNHKAALYRGSGLCSQKAVITGGFLQEAGINYRIIGLDGHVVVMAQVNPSDPIPWWILDPDYGVVIEHTIDEIEDNLDLITLPYQRKGYPIKTIEGLKEIYAKPGNFQTNSIENFLGAEKCRKERYSYILVWIIPLICIIPHFSRKLYTLL